MAYKKQPVWGTESGTMKYCVSCGTPLEQGESVCKSCGQIQPMNAPVPAAQPENDAAQVPPAVVPAYPYAPPQGAYSPYGRRRAPDNSARALPFLIWGLILIVLMNIGGVAAGVTAAIFSLRSGAAGNPAEAESNRRKAKIACIAGTCFDGAALLATVVYAVALFLRSRGNFLL